MTIFEQHQFKKNLLLEKKHASKVLVEVCSNGTRISISFPGYKAKITEKSIIYDYRVDITKSSIITSLSHANIIIDIYNKIQNGGMSAENLKEVLIEVAQEREIEIEKITARLPYKPSIPNQELLSRIKKAHGDKPYNRNGNSFDLTIEELLLSIKWIVLQEDINYPISQNFEGRKMPFARYLETVFITQNNSHSLEEVIRRALSHSRPNRWKELNYSFLNLIS